MGGRSTGFGHFFSKNPSDGVIVAMCDTIPEKAQAVAERFGLKAEIFDNVHDMIRKVPLDAVFISTHDAAHVEPATAALDANIDVFCEKPLATTLEDCDKIADAAKRSSATFCLGFNLRYTPIHETIHDIVATGGIGKVTTIEANEWYYGGKTYFRRWNRLGRHGGGLWITKCCHDFDILNWLADADPVSVYAATSLSHYKPKPQAAQQCRDCKLQFSCPDYYNVFRFPDPINDDIITSLKLIGEEHGQGPADLCLYNSDKDTFDNGVAVITYQNDIRAVYAINVVASRSTRQLRINGTEGCIEGDMGEGKIRVTERHTHKQYEYDMRTLMAGGHGGADDRLMRDFIRAVRTGAAPRTGCAEGRKSVRLGLAARESAETGQVVTF